MGDRWISNGARTGLTASLHPPGTARDREVTGVCRSRAALPDPGTRPSRRGRTSLSAKRSALRMYEYCSRLPTCISSMQVRC